MSGKAFFDTNVLVYAFREGDPRSETARILLAKGGVVGVQTLNELVAVARRKLAMSWKEILKAVAAVRVLCPLPMPITIETHEAAVRIAERYEYRIFDSLIIAAALEARCSTTDLYRKRPGR